MIRNTCDTIILGSALYFREKLDDVLDYAEAQGYADRYQLTIVDLKFGRTRFQKQAVLLFDDHSLEKKSLEKRVVYLSEKGYAFAEYDYYIPKHALL